MNRPADVEALKQLALKGALDGPVELASAEFATLLDLSQQTGSRRLIELAEAGLVHREMGLRKQRLRITPRGRGLLEAEHQVYARLFAPRDRVEVVGTVVTGLGEGRYYLSRPGYRDRFRGLLGWEPYPGTLNLQVPTTHQHALEALRGAPVHVLEPFHAEGRTFGGVDVYPAVVGRQPCAAIIPHRTHYDATLELIAAVSLRESLPCTDGEQLRVTVHLGKAKA